MNDFNSCLIAHNGMPDLLIGDDFWLKLVRPINETAMKINDDFNSCLIAHNGMPDLLIGDDFWIKSIRFFYSPPHKWDGNEIISLLLILLKFVAKNNDTIYKLIMVGKN
ncbi:hypothetical protein [Mucilaginibacter segetis]|uniref:Uncharacterized protein n=1 Tax=Mucilaginibacter segetis TaxID=2793071 RepID=A0A934PX95_9SPHI|nr:hypothetical protein [Mucilaginibacter segetis]MBK0380786.1 hypothetical protein [Mucilaginibacter segetis]